MYRKPESLGLALMIVYFGLLGVSCLPSIMGTSSKLPENIPIQEAKVDPAFATTEMKVIAFFPFSNAIQYDRGDVFTLYNNLIDQFRSKHPQYEFVPPDTVMAKVSSAGLSDDFNVFLGDHATTNVANPAFLAKAKKVLNFDAILFGKIEALGSGSRQESHRSVITGKIIYETIRYNQLGISLTCYRGKDGRPIWDGKHVLRENVNLASLSSKLADIFARYFGSRAY